MIYRCDDVSVYTDAYEFKKLHKKFLERGDVLTVAVIMEDLWKNQALFWYLATQPNISVGLHGWTHKDYSEYKFEDCYDDLVRSLKYWEYNLTRMLKLKEVPDDKKITVFFAPWNKRSPDIMGACSLLNLKFCDVRKGKWEGDDIVSFHAWNTIDDKFNI